MSGAEVVRLLRSHYAAIGREAPANLNDVILALHSAGMAVVSADEVARIAPHRERQP